MAKEPVIDLDLCKSCPKSYPWECWMCERSAMGCSRPKKPLEGEVDEGVQRCLEN